jgi:hypothetical protein
MDRPQKPLIYLIYQRLSGFFAFIEPFGPPRKPQIYLIYQRLSGSSRFISRFQRVPIPLIYQISLRILTRFASSAQEEKTSDLSDLSGKGETIPCQPK